MAPQLEPFFQQVDNLTDAFIDRLRKAVAIPSVSAQDETRPEVVKVCMLDSPLIGDARNADLSAIRVL
ncbi:hypothetical protein KEM55_006600 [Ascosphaera atra]|nr:hypothetical protein KEM55_006600 [Ascosphaera atra]